MSLAAQAEGPDHPGPSGASVFRGPKIKGKGCAPGRHILPPAGGPVYALALDSFYGLLVYLTCCPSPIWQQKGGVSIGNPHKRPYGRRSRCN